MLGIFLFALFLSEFKHEVFSMEIDAYYVYGIVSVCAGEYSNHLRFSGKLKNPLHPCIQSSPDPNPIRPHDRTLQPAASVYKCVHVCVCMFVVVLEDSRG